MYLFSRPLFFLQFSFQPALLVVWRSGGKKRKGDEGWNGALYATIELIDNAPAVEEKSQGEWVIEHDWVHCSSCGHEQNYPSDYCPKCGASMQKGEERTWFDDCYPCTNCLKDECEGCVYDSMHKRDQR